MDDINSKILSTILFWTYFVIGLLTEAYILWLFPNTGLGGLICWPATLFLSLVFAFGLLKLHKKFRNKRLTVTGFIAFLFIQVFLELLITPQEYGGEPFEQISEAISTYRQVEKIDFNDFSNLKQFERVAFIYMNKEKQPDSYLILSIDSVNDSSIIFKSKTYLIEKRNGKKIWNNKDLGLIENDSSTIITQYLNNGDSIIFKMTERFLNTNGGHVGEGVSLYVSEDNFELRTGMQKLFYGLLDWNKKASR